MISFAGMDSSPFSADDSEDLFFADDHVLDIVDLDFGADVLADEDTVAGLDVKRNPLAVVIQTTRSDGNDLPLERLLFGRVGDDEAAFHLLVGLRSLDQDSVTQWFHHCFHWDSLRL